MMHWSRRGFIAAIIGGVLAGMGDAAAQVGFPLSDGDTLDRTAAEEGGDRAASELESSVRLDQFRGGGRGFGEGMHPRRRRMMMMRRRMMMRQGGRGGGRGGFGMRGRGGGRRGGCRFGMTGRLNCR